MGVERTTRTEYVQFTMNLRFQIIYHYMINFQMSIIIGVHSTIGRPELSIGWPIPTVFLLVKQGIVQNTAMFSDLYLSFENRPANAQFWPANNIVKCTP